MTLGDRCDHIIHLIDEVLATTSTPNVGTSADEPRRGRDGTPNREREHVQA